MIPMRKEKQLERERKKREVYVHTSGQGTIRKVGRDEYSSHMQDGLGNIDSNESKKLKLGGGDVFFVVLLIGISIAILLSYAKVAQLKYDIVNQKVELSDLIRENQIYEIELDKIRESGWIEKYALQKLNMKYPEEGQIFYIKVPEETEQKDEDVSKQVLVGSKLTSILLDSFTESMSNLFENAE